MKTQVPLLTHTTTHLFLLCRDRQWVIRTEDEIRYLCCQGDEMPVVWGGGVSSCGAATSGHNNVTEDRTIHCSLRAVDTAGLSRGLTIVRRDRGVLRENGERSACFRYPCGEVIRGFNRGLTGHHLYTGQQQRSLILAGDYRVMAVKGPARPQRRSGVHKMPDAQGGRMTPGIHHSIGWE